MGVLDVWLLLYIFSIQVYITKLTYGALTGQLEGNLNLVKLSLYIYIYIYIYIKSRNFLSLQNNEKFRCYGNRRYFVVDVFW